MAITWTINREMTMASPLPAAEGGADDYVVNATFIDAAQGVNHTRNFALHHKADSAEGIAEIEALINEQIQPQQDATTLPNDGHGPEKFRDPASNNAVIVDGDPTIPRPTIASFKK
jgi:hypothetical protein